MKLASTTIKASALSLILFVGSACAQTNIESSKNLTKLEPQVQQLSDSVIAANKFLKVGNSSVKVINLNSKIYLFIFSQIYKIEIHKQCSCY